MVVVIDPQVAGISGDMLLCALVDLGADSSRILSGIRVAERHMPGSHIRRIEFVRQKRHGIGATCLLLDTDDSEVAKGGEVAAPPERHASEIRACLEQSASEIGLSDRARGFALACVDTLAGAESRIHDTPADSVHLHEVSGIDTVVDILGCAIALDDLGILDDEVVSTPVAVGGGTVEFSHGIHSNPAPAVLGILANSKIQIRGGPILEELTTPTGACLLANLAASCREFYPPLRVDSVGYGGGAGDFESFANVLRVVRGTAEKMGTDSVVVLETNVDDVSGEVLGVLIDRLMAGGARDVTISPAITKKNRPASLVTVLCADEAVDRMVGVLTAETGTLGVRIRRSERIVQPREGRSCKIEIGGTEFEVRAKVNPLTGRILKAESDDIRSVSEQLGLTFREAEGLIRDRLGAMGK